MLDHKQLFNEHLSQRQLTLPSPSRRVPNPQVAAKALVNQSH